MSVTARTLISDAFIELNVYRENQTPSANDASRGLRILNRIVSQWNARQLLIPCQVFQTVSLVAAQQLYTVGSGGNWNITRPLRIPFATVVIDDVEQPLTIRDKQWWNALRDKAATNTEPTDLYYNAASPLGQAEVWPVPTDTNDVNLYLEQQLASFAALDTSYDIEPSYESALVSVLKRRFCAPWRRPLTQEIEIDYREAMQIIESNSPYAQPPRIVVNDIGGRRGYFDTQLRRWI